MLFVFCRRKSFQLDGQSDESVTVLQKCPLKNLKLLLALCSRIQHLSIDATKDDLESKAQFLLDKNNSNTRHLYFTLMNQLDRSLKSKFLPNDDYTLKYDGRNVYLSDSISLVLQSL